LSRKADRKRLYSWWLCFRLVGWGFFKLSFGVKQSSRAELSRALQQRQEVPAEQELQLRAGEKPEEHPAAGTGREPRQHPAAAEPPPTPRSRPRSGSQRAALPLPTWKSLAGHCCASPFLPR